MPEKKKAATKKKVAAKKDEPASKKVEVKSPPKVPTYSQVQRRQMARRR
jgi:hypothetical protein